MRQAQKPRDEQAGPGEARETARWDGDPPSAPRGHGGQDDTARRTPKEWEELIRCGQHAIRGRFPSINFARGLAAAGQVRPGATWPGGPGDRCTSGSAGAEELRAHHARRQGRPGTSWPGTRWDGGHIIRLERSFFEDLDEDHATGLGGYPRAWPGANCGRPAGVAWSPRRPVGWAQRSFSAAASGADRRGWAHSRGVTRTACTTVGWFGRGPGCTASQDAAVSLTRRAGGLDPDPLLGTTAITATTCPCSRWEGHPKAFFSCHRMPSCAPWIISSFFSLIISWCCCRAGNPGERPTRVQLWLVVP